MFHRLFSHPLFLTACCAGLGSLAGSIRIGRFSLGSSATLLAGFGISVILAASGSPGSPIPGVLFDASLVGFIAAVGLKASRNLGSVLRRSGIRFALLGLAVPTFGAAVVYAAIRCGVDRFAAAGSFVGALTSSPALGTALELGRSGGSGANARIGLGYSIAYIPGVLLVILYSGIAGKYRRGEDGPEAPAPSSSEAAPFSVGRFALVVAAGIAIGSLRVKLGNSMVFSFGATGGVLVSALALGSFFPRFRFEDKALNPLRDIALNSFLAIVGLEYGRAALDSVAGSGLTLLALGTLAASASILAGHVLGRYFLKLEGATLAGALCGGMTSTPGLAAALDAFGSEQIVTAYAAAYPFALISMIVLTNLLFSVRV